jgi:hypothetical protein
VDGIGALVFYINNNDYAMFYHTNTNPSIFSIIFAVIQANQHGMIEYLWRIHKIKAMFADIYVPFLFIPFKFHPSIILTKRKYTNYNGGTIVALTMPPDPTQAVQNDCFNENRVGLDHASFNVGSREELEAAVRLFDEHGVSHGEIKDLGSGLGLYVLAFRDPDNIQLELTAPYG